MAKQRGRKDQPLYKPPTRRSKKNAKSSSATMADENAVKGAVEDIVDQVALSDEFEAVLGASPPDAEEQFEISKDDEAALLEDETEGGDQRVEVNENVEKVAEKDEEALSKPAAQEAISNSETQEDAAELEKEHSVEKENDPEANVEAVEAVEARDVAVPNEEAVPKPANDAEERPRKPKMSRMLAAMQHPLHLRRRTQHRMPQYRYRHRQCTTCRRCSCAKSPKPSYSSPNACPTSSVMNVGAPTDRTPTRRGKKDRRRIIGSRSCSCSIPSRKNSVSRSNSSSAPRKAA